MSNRKSMAQISAIGNLYRSGHSNRQIAKILDLNRETVGKYVAALKAAGNQNQPNSQTGSSDHHPNSQTGADKAARDEQPIATVEAKPAHNGPDSSCRALATIIEESLNRGLSIKRIHQDLQNEHGFKGSYFSVYRFVTKLSSNVPLPFRRMEVEPGEEAQIDFGTGAVIINSEGKQRRPWMFRIVLSHSRKAYSEVVYQQTTDNFMMAIENALHYFGGVPKRLVIDNLRAAVKQADWYDPETHPKLQSFAIHYGTVIVPTKPYTPEHKGKVESSVKYAKNNALKGRQFSSLVEQNDFLLEWESKTADTRIHGTTKEQVKKRFEQAERQALIRLPSERFANFKEARRSVSRDGHLEVDKAFYSTPPEYVGRRLWVRWDSRLVRIFNNQFQLIATHSKCEPGRFRTDKAHIPKEKVSAVERGTDALLRQIAAVGPHTKAWSEAMTAARGVEGVRVLVGLKRLAGTYRYTELEAACKIALSHGAYRLRTLRNLLKQGFATEQQQMDFIDEHPIIRPLSDYSLSSLESFRRER